MSQVQIEEKNVPRILCEILVYGHKDNVKKVEILKNSLQEQITKSRVAKTRARVLWYLDGGEKSIDEKKQWLIENAKCKYYVILNGLDKIDESFVKDTLNKIRTLEKSIRSIKSANICIAEKSNDKIQKAKVISIEKSQA
tara:strand:+ start:1044 stop:1463 length:420 start_codon:yes stop_codon:yes gene_type:complete